MPHSFRQDPASYRDPSGFVFSKDGVLYRQVNKSFAADFDHFIQSGCYDRLVQQGWILPHERIKENLTGMDNCYATLRPEPIRFLSYPYEWSFDMLRDAAMLTLRLVREAVKDGLILKDATPYNIQWQSGRLVFIDSLSFEKYKQEEPWIAYRQFCEQFLSPLLLMHYRQLPLHPLFLAWPEGIPLQVTKELLPARSKFSLHANLHIHLHARVSARAASQRKTTPQKFSKTKLLNLVGSLEILVSKLKLDPQSSSWSAYYDEASQRPDYLQAKKTILSGWLQEFSGVQTAADLGANEGAFSRLLSEKNIYCLAVDSDPWCINRLYTKIKEEKEKNLQPLIIDLSSPSPAIGFSNQERPAFFSRLKVDLLLALALVHHLAIGKNISFEMMARLFHASCRRWLVIEFVPKTDEKIKQMLVFKKDIYDQYGQDEFEQVFSHYFLLERREPVGSSGRILYLMSKLER